MSTFDEALGYAGLGMWQDAWDTIADLSETQRMAPPVFRLRLQCCMELDGWGVGEEIADFLAEGEEIDRKAAAGFFHQLAVHLASLRDTVQAKVAVAKAVQADQTIKLRLLDDPRLRSIW